MAEMIKIQMETISSVLQESVKGLVEPAVQHAVAKPKQQISQSDGLSCSHPQQPCPPDGQSAVSKDAQILQVVQPAAETVLPPGNCIIGANQVPLAAKVSTKLQAKIWAHEYVEFSSLLNPDMNMSYKLAVGQNSDGGTVLDMVPKHQKGIVSIAQWDAAFATFMAVYTEKYLEQVAELLQYGQQIKKLSLMGAHWCTYNENFRKKPSHPLPTVKLYDVQ